MVLWCTLVYGICQLVYAKTSCKTWLLHKHAYLEVLRFRPLCASLRWATSHIDVGPNLAMESLHHAYDLPDKCLEWHQHAAIKSKCIRLKWYERLMKKCIHLLVFRCKFKFNIGIIFRRITVNEQMVAAHSCRWLDSTSIFQLKKNYFMIYLQIIDNFNVTKFLEKIICFGYAISLLCRTRHCYITNHKKQT